MVLVKSPVTMILNGACDAAAVVPVAPAVVVAEAAVVAVAAVVDDALFDPESSPHALTTSTAAPPSASARPAVCVFISSPPRDLTCCGESATTRLNGCCVPLKLKRDRAPSYRSTKNSRIRGIHLCTTSGDRNG